MKLKINFDEQQEILKSYSSVIACVITAKIILDILKGGK